MRKTVQKSAVTKPYKFTQAQLKWLEALESGEYKQTRKGELCTVIRDKNQEIKDYKYCCLGLASELFCKNSDVEIEECGVSYHGEYAFAPDDVAKKLKLNDGRGTINKENLSKKVDWDESELAELNDNGWTFKRIAKFIRNNPRAVFRS